MTINEMTPMQKKWFSLGAALVIVTLASVLLACGEKRAEEAAARQKATDEAASRFMKQGNGKVRDWNASGSVGSGTTKDAKPAPASGNSTERANNAQK